MTLAHLPQPRTAVILAAGAGSRLNLDASIPAKCLVPVGGQLLLLRILGAARDAGIERAILILGEQSQAIMGTLRGLSLPLPIEPVTAPNCHLGNGASARAAQGALHEESFVLLMGDHLVSATLLRNVLRHARTCPGIAVLGTSSISSRGIDIDDATKVHIDDEGRIRAIAKDLSHYNGIDTGVFIYKKGIFAALADAAAEGEHSLSAANTRLAEDGSLYAAPVGDLSWQDVDTPQDLANAEHALAKIRHDNGSIRVAGTRVDKIDKQGLLLAMDEAIDTHQRRTIAYLNVHVANEANLLPSLRSALDRADHVYCDGEGIRLGARLLGHHLPSRMTGADLIWDVAAHLAQRKARIYWLGADKGIAEETLEIITRRFPNLLAAGSHHGFFSAADDMRAIKEINRSRADLLVVGMGTPRQELWIDRNRHLLEVPLVWAIGATGDFVTGQKTRAPPWMHQHGLEWLHRLLQEPQRLGRRYLLGNSIFLARVLQERMSRRS